MNVEWKPYSEYQNYPKEPCCVYLKRVDGTILEGVFDWRHRKDGIGLYFMYDGWLVGWNSGDTKIIEWAYRESNE